MTINDKFGNFKQFITLFRKKLSEYCDKEIIYLDDATKAIVPNNSKYPNIPIYSLSK